MNSARVALSCSHTLNLDIWQDVPVAALEEVCISSGGNLKCPWIKIVPAVQPATAPLLCSPCLCQVEGQSRARVANQAIPSLGEGQGAAAGAPLSSQSRPGGEVHKSSFLQESFSFKGNLTGWYLQDLSSGENSFSPGEVECALYSFYRERRNTHTVTMLGKLCNKTRWGRYSIYLS